MDFAVLDSPAAGIIGKPELCAVRDLEGVNSPGLLHGSVAPTMGMEVKKSGSRTEVTSGFISSIAGSRVAVTGNCGSL
jgi:hypothetical protein